MFIKTKYSHEKEEYMSYVYFNIVFYVNRNYSYANNKGKNSLHQYYKNMINCFETININKVENKVKLILFTNEDIPEVFKNRFDELHVSVVIKENNHIPPKGYTSMWQGTFFYLDSVKYLQTILQKEDIVFIIDPDCLVIKDFTPIVDKIKIDGILNYRVDYPFEYSQNGLSRSELKKIILEETNIDINPVIFGGEFYGIKGDNIITISKELDKAWEISLKRFYEKKEYFKTEEHIFTYVFYKLSYAYGNANTYLKRIWTSPSYNNVNKSDIDYIIWHLPAEKKRGLMQIYNLYLKDNNKLKNINGTTYDIVFGKVLGIPKKQFSRYLYDEIYKIIKFVYNKGTFIIHSLKP